MAASNDPAHSHNPRASFSCDGTYLSMRLHWIQTEGSGNRMLTRMLGSEKWNITDCWSKQCCELHYMRSSPNVIRVIIYEAGWDGQVM
jgi:hypothetical protein